MDEDVVVVSPVNLCAQLRDSYCTLNRVSKPPLPYFSGQEFTVRSHTAPPPIPAPPDGLPVIELSKRFERQQKHPAERCLLHPPSPGHVGNQIVHLKISREIRFRDNRKSQVGLVDILNVQPTKNQGPQKNMTLFAKFYDPLYNDHDSYIYDRFYCCDYDYSHEVAVYKQLKLLQGKYIPKFYGSFTLELPIPGHDTNRLVRLILLEYIPGRSIKSHGAGDFSQQERQRLLKIMIDTELTMYKHGFKGGFYRHDDIIINYNSRCAQRTRPIVLVDFGVCNLLHDGPEWCEIPVARWMKREGGDVCLAISEWIDWDLDLWYNRIYAGNTEIAAIGIPFIPRDHLG
ncbi:hypothetical protein H105_01510 [Trichophyton soudanense CBS 452.61]|uniref:Protein kinase domain-containing protein n=1 Tax=Trichophyton soudanense CBS 452.61 TaxID=1215331 RepID=A0A022Y3T7_TRISD|nr:hypothetical protein H105_01510 [Trichophyton soudanense CBS 452.61]